MKIDWYIDQAIPTTQPYMQKDLSILYVDDEQQNLITFKATFRKEYKIFTAQSGKDGLEILRNHPVHLVITDQRMPRMTGVEFLKIISVEYPEIIRIVLTGYSDMEAIIQLINTGQIFRYITKPWDEHELRLTIENARQMYELKQSNKQLLSKLQMKVEELERTLKLFMRYVPEVVVERTLNNTSASIFEGETKEIAVLFCDIRGFTSMSEVLEPRDVVGFLNDYYAMMTEIVKRYSGTVQQFVGDEVFACFGAPVATSANERFAVLCAIDMMKQREELNERYRTKMGQEIEMGIGINSGEVVAGNLGSEDRISYSVTGDTVNTGKRIEMLSKNIPNSILISEKVYQQVKELVDVRSLGPIEVKGKREKIELYQVKGRK